MTYEGAQRLIEHLAQGGRVTPTLKDVTDEQLQKMITDKLADCVRRAKTSTIAIRNAELC